MGRRGHKLVGVGMRAGGQEGPEEAGGGRMGQVGAGGWEGAGGVIM